MSKINTLLIPSPGIKSGRLLSCFPTGLYSIKEASRNAGREVDILNLVGDIEEIVFSSMRDIEHAIQSLFDPKHYNIIGLSTMGGTFPISIFLAENIKRLNPHTIVVLGGQQASFLPSEILKDFPFVDAVVVGEGEITFSEMLHCFRNSSDDWRGIPGVMIRTSPFVKRDLIKNLDHLPILRYNNHRKIYIKGTETDQNDVEGVRGCHARCRFCATTQFWQCRVRRKSPSRLVAEMLQIAEATDLSVFHIIGDNFTFPLKTFRETCKLMIKAGTKLKWKCDSRIGELEKDDLKLMKDAGCINIFVGIESASQETLNMINKKIDFAKTISMIEEALNLGIQIISSQIIGFPWEIERDVISTLKLHSQLLDLGVSNSIVNPLFPLAGAEGFPGTSLITDISLIEDTLPVLYQEEYSKELIRKYPHQFVQFGYYDTPHLRRSFVMAAIDAAHQIKEIKSYKKGSK